jgi:hypothetical protein
MRPPGPGLCSQKAVSCCCAYRSNRGMHGGLLALQERLLTPRNAMLCQISLPVEAAAAGTFCCDLLASWPRGKRTARPATQQLVLDRCNCD